MKVIGILAASHIQPDLGERLRTPGGSLHRANVRGSRGGQAPVGHDAIEV